MIAVLFEIEGFILVKRSQSLSDLRKFYAFFFADMTVAGFGAKERCKWLECVKRSELGFYVTLK